MALVRSYQPADHDQLIHIFNETASPDLRAAGSEILHLASFNWCRPYPFLCPEHCFVADDGFGRAVGYIIGAALPHKFGTAYVERYIPFLQSQGFQDPSESEPTDWNENLPAALRKVMFHQHESLLHKQLPGFIETYPAHFHIDLLPDWQRQGLGRQLMETFLADIKKHGAVGLSCGMVASNVEAGKFYSRMGFTPYSRKPGDAEAENSTTILQVKQL